MNIFDFLMVTLSAENNSYVWLTKVTLILDIYIPFISLDNSKYLTELFQIFIEFKKYPSVSWISDKKLCNCYNFKLIYGDIFIRNIIIIFWPYIFLINQVISIQVNWIRGTKNLTLILFVMPTFLITKLNMKTLVTFFVVV